MIRIALVGMYAGFFRDYNPGCFLIGLCTLEQLRCRLPDASFDIYARDFCGQYKGIRTETMRGIAIHHFPVGDQQSMLDGCLRSYDAVVIGGDVVWGDGERENDIFFLDSPSFLQASQPIVLYNAVHTFLGRKDVSWCRTAIGSLRQRAARLRGFTRGSGLVDHRARLRRCCLRASYVSVRAPYVQALLQGIVGSTRTVHCVPDPVFALEPSSPATRGRPWDLPAIGVSVRQWMADSFLDAVDRTPDLDGVRVVLYPYSRQYNQLEFVLSVRNRCGTRFEYIDAYPDPIDTLSLFGQFSASIHDTFHGTVLALTHGIPFAVFDTEPAERSRKRQLLERLHQTDRCIDLGSGGSDHRSRVEAWLEAFRMARTRPAAGADCRALRDDVEAHFDRMATVIRGAALGRLDPERRCR